MLRDVVRRPARWVAANAAAWPLATVVIFLGATRPDEDWPLASVLVVAAATEAAAGAVLGPRLWPWLRTMTPALSSGRHARPDRHASANRGGTMP